MQWRVYLYHRSLIPIAAGELCSSLKSQCGFTGQLPGVNVCSCKKNMKSLNARICIVLFLDTALTGGIMFSGYLFLDPSILPSHSSDVSHLERFFLILGEISTWTQGWADRTFEGFHQILHKNPLGLKYELIIFQGSKVKVSVTSLILPSVNGVSRQCLEEVLQIWHRSPFDLSMYRSDFTVTSHSSHLYVPFVWIFNFRKTYFLILNKHSFGPKGALHVKVKIIISFILLDKLINKSVIKFSLLYTVWNIFEQMIYLSNPCKHMLLCLKQTSSSQLRIIERSVCIRRCAASHRSSGPCRCNRSVKPWPRPSAPTMLWLIVPVSTGHLGLPAILHITHICANIRDKLTEMHEDIQVHRCVYILSSQSRTWTHRHDH